MIAADCSREVRSPHDLVSLLEPSDRVLMGHLESSSFVRALIAQADRLRGLTLQVWPLRDYAHYADPAIRDSFRVDVLGGFRHLGTSATLSSYLPCHLSAVYHSLIGSSGQPTVVITQVAPRNAHGMFSLGIAADYTWDFFRSGPRPYRTVVQVNNRMPVLPGTHVVPASAVDAVIYADDSLSSATASAANEDPTSGIIARRVASLVADGSTIQLGIGSLAGSVAAALGDKNDLGVHTGVIYPELLRLLADGNVTNRYKPTDRSRSIASVVMADGSYLRSLAPRAADLKLELRPYSVNSADRIAAIPRFVSLNQCLQVDLFGRVYSELVFPRAVSTLGGLGDFVDGARLSPGGRSVVFCPSTRTASGDRKPTSKIVPPPTSIGWPSVRAADVDFVVTEIGVAELRGKTVRQRCAALIEIAEHEFQPWLKDQAARLGLL